MEDEQEYEEKHHVIGRIIFALMLSFVLYACLTPSPQPKPKKATKKVIINQYPFDTILVTGGGGDGGTENYFKFYPKVNNNPYPTTDPVTTPNINDYMAFQFASWSIVSKPASSENALLQSWIKFMLYDSSNNLVCEIQDKRGNYHPNYTSYFPDGTDLRHNNHQYIYRKYLPVGAYRLEMYNISPQPITQNLRLGTQGTGGDVYSLINEGLEVGHKTFNFNIVNKPDGQMYEFDCNPY